uniref:Uncharacterized protein n=1 Tax=Arundo donax TaxID=35708 RepID=A0A0A9EF89_ARUDO
MEISLGKSSFRYSVDFAHLFVSSNLLPKVSWRMLSSVWLPLGSLGNWNPRVRN